MVKMVFSRKRQNIFMTETFTGGKGKGILVLETRNLCDVVTFSPATTYHLHKYWQSLKNI